MQGRKYQAPYVSVLFPIKRVSFVISFSACSPTCQIRRPRGHSGATQSCAIDPGAVATSIYKGSIIFSRPPASWVMRMLYAPPQDGARIVIDALRAPWPRPALPKAEGTSGESIARAASLQGGPERLASPGTNPEQDLLVRWKKRPEQFPFVIVRRLLPCFMHVHQRSRVCANRNSRDKMLI